MSSIQDAVSLPVDAGRRSLTLTTIVGAAIAVALTVLVLASIAVRGQSAPESDDAPITLIGP